MTGSTGRAPALLTVRPPPSISPAPASPCRLCGTPGPRAAVLVRPDGHIAWCASEPGDTPLLPALRSLLSAP
ncbi:hypothetical protein [Streptomyces sp. NBC_00654]|uniref:aromatic-ring hydroxylase C-terminal domain-containing protein n=1 Tax=Streptomyces sp. NBC_00654 TaxID=2975799 RepID=UPI00339045CF